MVTVTINDMSDDIRLRIILMLSPTDLLNMSISHNWLSIMNHDELIWKRHTEISWSKTSQNTPTSSLLERVRALNINQLKKYLTTVDCKGCIEKNDYQSKLIAYLVFKRRFHQASYKPKSLPQWAQKIGEWKVIISNT